MAMLMLGVNPARTAAIPRRRGDRAIDHPASPGERKSERRSRAAYNHDVAECHTLSAPLVNEFQPETMSPVTPDRSVYRPLSVL